MLCILSHSRPQPQPINFYSFDKNIQFVVSSHLLLIETVVSLAGWFGRHVGLKLQHFSQLVQIQETFGLKTPEDSNGLYVLEYNDHLHTCPWDPGSR